MQLNEDLIKAVGFNLISNPFGKPIWIDSFGLTIYPDQMPSTLYELVRIMTGTSFKKGKKKATEEQTFLTDLQEARNQPVYG